MNDNNFENIFVVTASHLYRSSVSNPVYNTSDWELVAKTYHFSSSEDAVRIAIKEVYHLLLETTATMNEN